MENVDTVAFYLLVVIDTRSLPDGRGIESEGLHVKEWAARLA